MVVLEVLDEDKRKARIKHVVERNTGRIAVNYIDNKLTPVYAPFNNEIVLSDEDMSKLEDKDRIMIKVDYTVGDKTYCHLFAQPHS